VKINFVRHEIFPGGKILYSARINSVRNEFLISVIILKFTYVKINFVRHEIFPGGKILYSARINSVRNEFLIN
jgi:5'(3')-deoxyribonucleotidase